MGLSVSEKPPEGADHSGHRGRLREKYLGNGLSALADHEIIELLLFGAIPRQNTNDLAHRLCEAFNGSLAELLNASPDMIRSVKGAGEQVVVLIKLINELRVYAEERGGGRNCTHDPGTWFECLKPYFSGASDEMVYMLSMNHKYQYLGVKKISSGTAGSAPINLRDVIKESLNTGARYVVLAHNHLNGVLAPSKRDLSATSLVSQSLQAVDVKLSDHLIISGGGYASILCGGPWFDA